jgi:hypothetical protein
MPRLRLHHGRRPHALQFRSQLRGAAGSSVAPLVRGANLVLQLRQQLAQPPILRTTD